MSIDWQPDGRLLVVAGSDRRLLRQEDDGGLGAFVDLAPICDRPWNEVVVDDRGHTFVSSIGFDMMAGEDPAPGVLAVVTPDGEARLAADDLAFPNGMVVTPDGTLVVAESHGNRLTAFTVQADGSLSDRRIWADLGELYPDGTCLDAEGAIWCADVPHRTCVRVRPGGEVAETITLDRGCFACALGGEDGRTLFLLATRWDGTEGMGAGEPSGQLLAVEVDVPAAGHP